ncbi:hypothetical protein [Ornithinimicrobium cerasi]|uniref:hypothetical protein n=1 Tax=Ornithinimicrobium cerasi TaxID=2248773 RepID=UPI000EFE1BA4|nr:hypothetical protein [Ornithinimicrobium cerasi]
MRELLDLWADLRSASRTHLLVRGVALGGSLLFALSYALAGGGNLIAWLGLVVLGLLVVVQPHTLAPGLFLGYAVASWWATVPSTWHWALLPAALGLLVLHTAAALCASVPAQAPIPRTVLRRWLDRVAVVAAGTVVVWGLSGLLTLRRAAGLGAVPGIVGLLVLAVALVILLRRRGPSAA